MSQGLSRDRFFHGLYFSTVGEDVEKNDFLENIPPECLSNYVPPTPSPTPEPTPTPTPTPEPTATPTPEPTATPAPAQADGISPLLLALLGVICLLSVCLVILLLRRRRS